MGNEEDRKDPSLVEDSVEDTDAPDAPSQAGTRERERGPDAPLPVEPVLFESLSPSAESQTATGDLDFLADVDLDVAVELGCTGMSLREVLTLCPGVVIELDKLAGEPVDILVNDKLVGRGEVVVVEDMFGVRVTEIIPPSERWKH
ncbi:MAG: Flagellar motor switch protein FliN [Anaerolineales bacterium]|nr:Flagellar motor switch protein FliN [Anaerolineales bacterium]